MKPKTKVLVTGAHGQLGRTIQELYYENELDLDFMFVSKDDLDITDLKALAMFFEKHNFDYCINCAAYTNVKLAEKTPELAFAVNAEGMKNLATLCKKQNIVLIHVSTDYVFDGEKEDAYTTQDIPNPINQYGKSKLLGEHYIRDILSKYYIVRTSWLYSKKYGHNFYKTILSQAEQKKISVVDDEIGCPTNAINLAKYLVRLILKKEYKYGILHFCDDKSMTWYEFAKEILRENNLLELVELKRRRKADISVKRPKHSVLLRSNLDEAALEE